MASCASCGQSILFGGLRDGELRFCNETCHSNAVAVRAALTVPEGEAKSHAEQIRMGPCPRCQGPGPVDVHLSYWVWSAVAFTRWGSQQLVSCRRCAVRSQIGNLVFSGAFGWWGFPHGFLITPLMITRNLAGIFSSTERPEPSPRLIHFARMHLGSQPRSNQSG